MAIYYTMTRYLRENRFEEHSGALFYVERTLSGGKIRRGLIGMVDLEQYDYEPGARTLIRATEGTVLSRIPPRVAVRKNAPIELPHVMLLCDDARRTVIEPLGGETADMERLYDFELMENCMSEQEMAQECSRCLRCDHYGHAGFKGGRLAKW